MLSTKNNLPQIALGCIIANVCCIALSIGIGKRLWWVMCFKIHIIPGKVDEQRAEGMKVIRRSILPERIDRTRIRRKRTLFCSTDRERNRSVSLCAAGLSGKGQTRSHNLGFHLHENYGKCVSEQVLREVLKAMCDLKNYLLELD